MFLDECERTEIAPKAYKAEHRFIVSRILQGPISTFFFYIFFVPIEGENYFSTRTTQFTSVYLFILIARDNV